MSYSVSYTCPRCGAVCKLEREGYLADRSVTPHPYEGWTYTDPTAAIEEADGIRFVCGEGDVFRSDEGCDEPFYLNFVRFEDGEEIEPPRESEYVELSTATGPRWPSGPSGSRR